jgi:hypothetical protein
MLLKIGFRILDLIVLKFWNMKSKLNRHLSIKDFLIFQGTYFDNNFKIWAKQTETLWLSIKSFRIVNNVVSCVCNWLKKPYCQTQYVANLSAIIYTYINRKPTHFSCAQSFPVYKLSVYSTKRNFISNFYNKKYEKRITDK